MSGLKRITTNYNEQEDRIAISGLTENEQTVILLLTMRLANRLIKHCLGILEKHVSSSGEVAASNEHSRKSVHNFVQKSVEQQAPQETAVKVTNKSPKHLIIAIDVKNAGTGITLKFKEELGIHYEIFLNSHQLRQWLGMLHAIWQKTEWPVEIWPDWMGKDQFQPSQGEISLH